MASLIETTKGAEWYLEDMRLMDQKYDALAAELASVQNPRVYAKVSDIPGETQSANVDEMIGQQVGGQTLGESGQPQAKRQSTTSQTKKSDFQPVPNPNARTKEQIERDMLNVLLAKQSIGFKKGTDPNLKVNLYRTEDGLLISGTDKEIGQQYKGKKIYKLSSTTPAEKQKQDVFWIDKKNTYFTGTADEAAQEATKYGSKFYQFGKFDPDDINKGKDKTPMVLTDKDGTIYGYGLGLKAPVEDYVLRDGQSATKANQGSLNRIPLAAYKKDADKSTRITKVEQLKEKWVADQAAYRVHISEFFKDIKDKKGKNAAISRAMTELRKDTSSLYKLHDLFVDGDIKQYYGVMSDTTLMSGMFEGKNQQALSMENYLKTTMRDIHSSFIKKLSGDDQAIPVTVEGGVNSLSISEWNNFKSLRVNKQFELMRSRALRHMQNYATNDANHENVLSNNPVTLIRQVLEENAASTNSTMRAEALTLPFNPDVVKETFSMLSAPNLSIDNRLAVDNMFKAIKESAKNMKRLKASDTTIRQEVERVFSNFPPAQKEAFINEVMSTIGKEVSMSIQNTKPAGMWFNGLFMNNRGLA